MGKYIVCYDIENSKLYAVAEENGNASEAVCNKALSAVCTALKLPDDGYINPDIAAEVLGDKWHKQVTEVLDDISLHLHQKKKKRGKDTSTALILFPFTHKYLSNFLIYNVDKDTTESRFAHSPEEDDAEFQKLIDLWKAGNDIVFTAHNLDYEYSYIRYNTTFLQRLTEAAVIDPSIIAENTTHIKSITWTDGVLEVKKDGKQTVKNKHIFKIQDTCLMAGGRGIKALGNAYGLPKLDYEYDSVRLCKDDLNPHDYEYNQRDNEVALLFIKDLLKQNPDYFDIEKLPISATQHAKNTCRNNPIVNAEVPPQKIGKVTFSSPKHKNQKKFTYYDQHRISTKTFNMANAQMYHNFFCASGGGVVGVNPLQTGKWHDGCYSFDISSAHPSQAFHRRYPVGKTAKEIEDEEGKKSAFGELLARAVQLRKNPHAAYINAPYKYDYLMLVEFEGLEARRFPNGNEVDSLGKGNVRDLKRAHAVKDADGNYSDLSRCATSAGVVATFGKVRKADYYCKWFYGIDLIGHLTFYKYKAVRVLKCYKMNLQPADEYTLRRFEFYGQAKYNYKLLKEAANKHGKSFDEVMEMARGLDCIEAYTLANMTAENYKSFTESELIRIKGIFNGVFGTEYTDYCHPALAFDNSNPLKPYNIAKTADPDYKEALDKASSCYCIGAYIAAYSRYELVTMLWRVMRCGGTVLYWATDSVKCCGVPQNIFDNWLDGMSAVAATNRNKWGFGAVDCENKLPMSIYVVETLKYVSVGRMVKTDKETGDIISDKIDIHSTVSGFRSGNYLKSIFEDNKDVEWSENAVRRAKKRLAWAMRPHVIPAEETGKTVRDRKYAGWRTPLGQVNFGAIVDVAYNLGDNALNCMEYNINGDIITEDFVTDM